MRRIDQIKARIIDLVSRDANRRMRAYEIEQKIRLQLGDDSITIKEALADLIEKDELVFSYRGPYGVVLIPIEQECRDGETHEQTYG
jgi:hypothetical protein